MTTDARHGDTPVDIGELGALATELEVDGLEERAKLIDRTMVELETARAKVAELEGLVGDLTALKQRALDTAHAQIASLQLQNERLREAAVPIADFIRPTMGKIPPDLILTNGSRMALKQLTAGEFIALAKALSLTPPSSSDLVKVVKASIDLRRAEKAETDANTAAHCRSGTWGAWNRASAELGIARGRWKAALTALEKGDTGGQDDG